MVCECKRMVVISKGTQLNALERFQRDKLSKIAVHLNSVYNKCKDVQNLMKNLEGFGTETASKVFLRFPFTVKTRTGNEMTHSTCGVSRRTRGGLMEHTLQPGPASVHGQVNVWTVVYLWCVHIHVVFIYCF